MRAASVGAPPGQITTTGISARLSSIDHAPKKNPPGTGDRGRGKGIHQDAQGASILTVSPVSRGTNPRFKNTHRKTRQHEPAGRGYRLVKEAANQPVSRILNARSFSAVYPPRPPSGR